jgi:glycosyltransferase involved in cell wall biosynthesis
MKPSVSVIIPVKNGQRTLKKCLDSLRKLTYPNFEVIVIDDGSTDNTVRILKEFPEARVITTKGVGPSRARNMAMRQAKGEFVAFTDADCTVDSRWLDSLMAGFSRDEIVGVGGKQCIPADETSFGQDIQALFKILGFMTDYSKKATKKIKTLHNPTCNAMYRKKTIMVAGGFLQDLWPGEDLELDYRLRKQRKLLVFNPDAIVYHYRPKTVKEFCKMMLNYGRAQAFLVKKYGFFRKIHYEPLIFIVAVSTFIIFVIMGANPIFYITATLLPFLLIYFSTRRWRIPFLFLLLLLFWNVGFFKGLLKRHNEKTI